MSGTNFITDYCSCSPWNATTMHSYTSTLPSPWACSSPWPCSSHCSCTSHCISPWAPCSYSSSSRHYSVCPFCFCFQNHHSSKSSFYCISVNVIEKITPATESKPDWNQLWLAQFTQHKSAVCQLFNGLFIISWDIFFILILFLNWYHCRSRGFYTVSKVWNIVFAIVGCCVLTFVNTTKTIHNFVGRYSLSVKKM